MNLCLYLLHTKFKIDFICTNINIKISNIYKPLKMICEQQYNPENIFWGQFIDLEIGNISGPKKKQIRFIF